MSHKKTYPEGTSVYNTFTFLSKTLAPQVPTSITYRVDCATTGTVLAASTPITPPLSSVEISVPGAANVIIDPDNEIEEKVVTVVASYGVDDQSVSESRYLIRNMNFYP